MSEAKPKPFLSLELRCGSGGFSGCGSSLFIELPQQPERFSDLPLKLVDLATAWTAAHKAHHQEPKK